MLLASALVMSCASVPRDAGFADVQQAVASRLSSSTSWNADVHAMLEDAVTADEAVAIALTNNPRLQMTLAELGIARAELIEASTIANPIFEFELRVPGEPYRPYELRIAQTLVDLIQLPRRRAVGRTAFDAAQMRVTSDVLRFAADVRSVYYDVVAATQHVVQSRTILDAARTAAEVAVKQHAAENITDLDLENEQALYEQAKLDLARAERQLLVQREALLRAMSLRDAPTDWRVATTFPELPSSELDQRQLEELAAQQRLDLAIARREVEVAERRVPLARLASLREIDIDVHYEREPSGEHTVGPGIQLLIPIFNNGRAGRTRAEAEFLRARFALQTLTAESSSRLRTASSVVAEARARVEYYRDVLLPRRRRIVELTKLEHNAMLVGIFQLLQARQNEAQAERDFIEAQLDYWTARTSLDRALQGIADDTSFSPATDQGTGKQADVSRGGR
jgi:cobalt-zinc-cadmium efflux system outer membrane protein